MATEQAETEVEPQRTAFVVTMSINTATLRAAWHDRKLPRKRKKVLGKLLAGRGRFGRNERIWLTTRRRHGFRLCDV